MAEVKKSLAASHHRLASSDYQLEVLDQPEFTPFHEKLESAGLFPLKPTGITIFQVNVGKMCNQTCAHCHVDAGPDRKEIMIRNTMEECLYALGKLDSQTAVDLTGGAPEMNPDFRWFVEEIRKQGKQVMVRCNLTIIVANKMYNDLPDFFKKHNVEVISSLPFYNAARTDRQRGEGVFDSSIIALKMLNAVGYGKEPQLKLNLVYNPSGAFLPASQAQLEADFKQELKNHYNIDFNNLYCITNMPISRYLDYLINSGNYESYMEKLVSSFNPAAAASVMCRNTISIGWDGYLYDCDFNQMLDLKLRGKIKHVREFNLSCLNDREIIVNQHCYGCTAGAGSSCGGAVS